MKRFFLASLGIAISLPLIGCELVLDIDPDDSVGLGDPEPTPDEPLRGEFNRDVLPILAAQCSSCHDGQVVGIDFMSFDATTAYDSVKAWPALINLEEPFQSRLVTKGIHDGPAFDNAELDVVIGWLEDEANF